MLNVGPVLVDGHRSCAAGNIFKPHRHEIPDIDTDIHAIARAFPIVMDMREELKRISAGVVPCDHWVMAERMRLSLWAIPDFGEVWMLPQGKASVGSKSWLPTIRCLRVPGSWPKTSAK